MSEKILAKYRVIHTSFEEYVDCGDVEQNTNVHTVKECDVVAETATEAIQLAAKAFGPGSLKSGEWSVAMRASPHEKGAVGSRPSRSTIANASRPT